LNDANKSLELDPKYIKGYYRRASANLALGKFKNALRDYEYVCRTHNFKYGNKFKKDKKQRS
jgi:serine/threonine-protein phosphatase 5